MKWKTELDLVVAHCRYWHNLAVESSNLTHPDLIPNLCHSNFIIYQKHEPRGKEQKNKEVRNRTQYPNNKYQII